MSDAFTAGGQIAVILDLLEVQKELPALQKSAINPHFKNRYIPLEELIAAVVPILNKHNFVLLQMPTFAEGQPALATKLLHSSGPSLETTMPLLCAKDDPQGQGSAITYARRYSLMAMLGMSADPDDDAQSSMPRQNGVSAPIQRPVPTAAQPKHRAPRCPLHKQEMNYRRAGEANGKPYPSFYSCPDRGCKRTINVSDWEMQQDQLTQPSEPMTEPDAVPFE